MNKKQKKMLTRILIAAIMVAALSLVPVQGYLRAVLYMIPYLVIGYDILLKAWKGIRNRQVFDENFLMAVATVGAICLGDFKEGTAVMLFYQIGELFQSYAVGKSRRNISELMDIRPDYANVERNGSLEKVDPDEVEIGSIIVVQPGEKVPIDGIITEGKTTLNTSALTGESLPRDAKEGDEIISGCINMTGVLKIRTTREFGESTVSKILDLVENSSSRKSRSENFISKFARYYTPVVCYSALALAILPPLVRLMFMGLDPQWGDWVYRALTFLVISCPCALVISIPLSFFAGIGGASNAGVLVKGSNYMETLAQTRYVVFDKTGTLTNGKIKVTKVTSYGEMSENDILKFSATAEEYSAHPIAQAIKQKAKLENVETLKADDYQEKAGNGVTAIIDGKNYTVGHIGLLSEEDKKKITDDTSVFLLIDGKLVGGITVNDTIRTETPKVLKNLKELGAKDLVMLTGDNKKKAESVAKLTGITKLFSNLLPNEKVKHMEELKKSHKATVFVGDGINDAPVIALADCGVAMGLGSDAAIEASDAVLSDGTLKSLPTMVKTSRRIMNTIRAVITFALVVKALVIVLAIFGIAPMWLGVLSDTGLSMICILYAMRLLKPKD